MFNFFHTCWWVVRMNISMFHIFHIFWWVTMNMWMVLDVFFQMNLTPQVQMAPHSLLPGAHGPGRRGGGGRVPGPPWSSGENSHDSNMTMEPIVRHVSLPEATSFEKFWKPPRVVFSPKSCWRKPSLGDCCWFRNPEGSHGAEICIIQIQLPDLITSNFWYILAVKAEMSAKRCMHPWICW